MHLTNYSLNVHSGNFVHSDSHSTGSKRTLSSVLYRLAAKGVDIKKVWSDIIALVIKTVIAVVPELKVYYQADIPPGKPGPTCFQVGSVVLGIFFQSHNSVKPKSKDTMHCYIWCNSVFTVVSGSPVCIKDKRQTKITNHIKRCS